uniref:Uncharacterized protein n=1 Tax=Buteo japonicus TaxID=224669 RepID=A0A8C0AMN5_9AVES
MSQKFFRRPPKHRDRLAVGHAWEEFCEIFRAKEKTTGKLYTCKKFLKRDGRKGEAPQHPAAGGRLHHPQGPHAGGVGGGHGVPHCPPSSADFPPRCPQPRSW